MMRRLVIISAMSHYLRNGRLAGWGPTVIEIDHLASLFESVTHLGCFYAGMAPASAVHYGASNIQFVGLAPTGGTRLRDKACVLLHCFKYARTIWRALRDADAVHVRCPANTCLVAVLLLAVLRSPKTRWIKYGGDWGAADVPWSFRLQRWWLAHGLHKGIVTINGTWPNQPRHVHSFHNPCLGEEEIGLGRQAAAQKSLGDQITLLFAGRVESGKGLHHALEIIKRLREVGVSGQLLVAGDGRERPAFERMAEELGIANHVRFLGWIARPQLPAIYSRAHITLFPSESEGWPKVLSEGMAFGVVPVASAVGSIPQYIASTGCGRAIAPADIEGFVAAIRQYVQNPAIWREESERGVKAAEQFSYREYLQRVRSLLGLKQDVASEAGLTTVRTQA
jgi:glycosyltransferase involved in cell wall biosynthesis